MTHGEIVSITGTAVPIVGNDIDTDRIIPARFLKEITFEKMGEYLFYDVRFDQQKNPKEHPLNEIRFLGASIAFVNKNFGCGSSREHAPQAIKRFGIQAVVGESFAEIFAGNCQQIGVPAVKVSEKDIQFLQDYVQKNPTTQFELDIAKKELRFSGQSVSIEMPESRQKAFLTGSWNVLNLLKMNSGLVHDKHNTLPY